MKRLHVGVLFAALMVGMLLLVGCEPMGPKLEITETSHNFGEMDQHTAVSHTFVLRNAGDQDLEITKIRSSCGCTAAKPEEKVIKPGGQTEIKVTFNSGGRSGAQKKKVTIETNDPNNPKIMLYMEGTVVEKLAFEPRAIRLVDMEPGQQATGEVKIINKSPNAITLQALNYEEGSLVKVELRADEAIQLPYELAAGAELTLAVTGQLPEGQNGGRATVSLITADQPDKPLPLSVVMRKKGTGFKPKKLALDKKNKKKKKVKKAKKLKKKKKAKKKAKKGKKKKQQQQSP